MKVVKQYVADSETHFLIKQFDEFWKINEIGVTTNQYHFFLYLKN